MKVVVSFTTSPERISKIKPMVDSILNQTRKPDIFVLNIAKVFPRTGKSYVIPDFIKNSSIVVNVIDRDYGPATKVIPTIQFVKEKNMDLSNTRIIYVDDDIKQLPNMINTFLKYTQNEKIILGTSGFDFKNSTTKKGWIGMFGQRDHCRIVNIIEGYGAVCLSPNVFKDDFMDYFNSLASVNYCLLSDDFILSNYYYKHNNKCVIINTPNFSITKLTNRKGILEYGNQKDALHILNGNDNGNLIKYVKCIKYLLSRKMLYLNFENNMNQGKKRTSAGMKILFTGKW